MVDIVNHGHLLLDHKSQDQTATLRCFGNEICRRVVQTLAVSAQADALQPRLILEPHKSNVRYFAGRWTDWLNGIEGLRKA